MGQYQRPTETGFSLGYVEMGARVYVPALGKFLQRDPVLLCGSVWANRPAALLAIPIALASVGRRPRTEDEGAVAEPALA